MRHAPFYLGAGRQLEYGVQAEITSLWMPGFPVRMARCWNARIARPLLLRNI